MNFFVNKFVNEKSTSTSFVIVSFKIVSIYGY